MTAKIRTIAADLCRRMAADFERLWAAGRPQGAGEYWPYPQKPDYTITAETPPQETERILRAFFGFDCYLKTKEAEYRIVRGCFARSRTHAPLGRWRPGRTGQGATRSGAGSLRQWGKRRRAEHEA